MEEYYSVDKLVTSRDPGVIINKPFCVSAARGHVLSSEIRGRETQRERETDHGGIWFRSIKDKRDHSMRSC